MSKTVRITLIPIMFSFFVMGFVDMVGTSSDYLQQDLGLSDTMAGALPFVVFIWFPLCAVPAAVMMNLIGRKSTVMLSLSITLMSFIPPIITENLFAMGMSFSMLGIGNALMQTSLNPLVTDVTDSHLAATLTFGQFVKAIASYLPTALIPLAITGVIPTFKLSWRVIFLIFAVITIITTVLLQLTPISEDHADIGTGRTASQQMESAFRAMGIPMVALSALAIMCHVGIDVGTYTMAPALAGERFGLCLADNTLFATSVYFIARTAGCLAGSFVLRAVRTRIVYIVSVLMIAVGVIGLFAAPTLSLFYVAIALVGAGNSNVFPMVYSQAILAVPDKKNEVSGLMISGLIGGAVFPLLMNWCGAAVDSHMGALAVMSVGVAYMIYYISKVWS